MKLAITLIGLVLAGCGTEDVGSQQRTQAVVLEKDQTLSCRGVLRGYRVSYTVSENSKGDVDIAGVVSSASASIGLYKTNLYSEQQDETSASIILDSLPDDNSGSWTLSADKDTKIMTVVISAPTPIRLSLPASACTKNL